MRYVYYDHESKKCLSMIFNQIEKAKKSQLYKNKFTDCSLNTWKDFYSLPFTSKDEIKNLGTYSNLSADIVDIVEVHSSSGTTGTPVSSFLTPKDLFSIKKHISKAWEYFGVDRSSKVLFCMNYGMFSGAALNSMAIQYLGGFVIPCGIGSLDYIIRMINSYKPNFIVGTPLFLLKLGDVLDSEAKSYIKTLISAGEVCPVEILEKIEFAFDAKVFDHYGLCEIDTGICYECRNRRGLHIISDIVFHEIIDPETGKNLGYGEKGELVLTTLKKDGSPLIRYKTGDLTKLVEQRCESCGSSHPLIERISGRVTDTVFYKGLKIEINDIYKEIVHFPELSGEFTVDLSKDNFDAPMVVNLEKSLNYQDISSSILDNIFFKKFGIKKVIFNFFEYGYFDRSKSLKIKRVNYV